MLNALITGLHRSGTTLICHLLNKLPNAVALDEPIDVSIFQNISEEEIVKAIHSFFLNQRFHILDKGMATSKTVAGKVPSNQLADATSHGARQSVIDSHRLLISNVSGVDFDLFVKHPAVFTAMLPCLEKHFPCFANIRNPLSVLLSWRTCNFNVTNGRAPAAEMMDPALKHRLDAQEDRLERQLILLDFFFSRYADCRETTIIRYEDVVATSGRALSVMKKTASRFTEPLSSRNALGIDDSSEVETIAKKLLNDASNACWRFYDQADILALLPTL